MLDQHAKVEKSIDRLECLGAQTSSLRLQAGFSAGMDLQALSTWSEGLGDYVRKLDCADTQGPAGSAHFAGIGDGEPARCMEAAVQMQQAHQQQLHHAAGSVGDCVQFVQSVMEQCAAGVESIAVSAQGLCSAMRAMKPGPECEAIVQSLLTHAVQAVMGLLTTRNDTLGQLCQQAVVDVQPASVHEDVGSAVSTQACGAAVAAEGSREPVLPAPPAPCDGEASVVHAAHAVGSVQAGAGLQVTINVGAPPALPPLIDAQQLSATINNHVNMATAAWHQCLQGAAELLCPQHVEASAAPSLEPCTAPSADVCEAPEPASAPEPPSEPEPVPEPAEQPQGGFDKTQHPSHPDSAAPAAEQSQPESAPAPAEQQGGFDKTQHPSHPDSAAPAAEHLQPESAPAPAEQQGGFDKTQHPSHPDSATPAAEPAEQQQCPEPATPPVVPPETPANPATESPASPQTGEGQSSWTPDIWIEVQADSAVGSFGAADFEEPTTPAASLVGSSASVEVNIERSEKW